LGCPEKERNHQARDATLLASASGERDVPPAASASPVAALSVDEGGIVAFEHRWNHPDNDDKTLREAVARVSGSVVSIFAARAAPYLWVSALFEALGASGATGVDMVTAPAASSPDAGARILRLSPLGQVPMHEDRCGARITITARGTTELRYLKTGKPLALPPGVQGPDLSPALADLRNRMKGCESTVWMLSGEEGTVWGAVFEVGLAVSAEKGPREARYVMLVAPLLNAPSPTQTNPARPTQSPTKPER
jgi:hypothetical protein